MADIQHNLKVDMTFIQNKINNSVNIWLKQPYIYWKIKKVFYYEKQKNIYDNNNNIYNNIHNNIM